ELDRVEYVTFDDATVLAAARLDPQGFLKGYSGGRLIIDEVQRAPELFRAIKIVVDRDRKPGRFLLTGSANLLLLPKIGDSLAGRIEIVRLHPLTESEKARRPGAFLGAFLGGTLAPRLSSDTGDAPGELISRILQGGYPPPLVREASRARQWHRQYIQTLVERDVRDVARVREADELTRLLEMAAIRTAQLLNLSSLGTELGMRRETIDQYLGILERLFLVRRLPAWHHNEGKRLIKTPKMHIADSGLAAALTGWHGEDWLHRRDRIGPFIESFVVQQIMAQATWTDPDLRFWHYRDKDQIEVDLVVTRGRKTWGVEVKASSTVTPADGRGLHRLADQCGRDFQHGIILYAGASTLPTSDARILAIPLSELWTR
ncbi:MAG: ATP-binding protein, partial [Planctomycetes bacterium]|nr:ATP-binding protein [Planctomycetota bacterium]